ncbi:DNA helicase rad5 [Nowakowskiella sp. JEL0407]|nr:DNA helicase rad5 [Nowakowskiella sp. JEL0407]
MGARRSTKAVSSTDEDSSSDSDESTSESPVRRPANKGILLCRSQGNYSGSIRSEFRGTHQVQLIHSTSGHQPYSVKVVGRKREFFNYKCTVYNRARYTEPHFFILSDRAYESNCKIYMRIAPNSRTLTFEAYWNSKNLESPEALEEELVLNYLLNGRKAIMLTESPHVPYIENDQRIRIEDFPIPDTFDVIPCSQLASPFKIRLYDYQLRTLAWMQGVEDGDDLFYYAPNIFPFDEDRTLNLFNKEIGPNEEIKQKNPGIRGGIIADKPGIGKTITTIALCHTRPFQLPEGVDEDFIHAHPSGRILSKATLIVVPNNISKQWAEEFQKCLGKKANVLQIRGKREYEHTSIEDIVNAEIIILTYNFLNNPLYSGNEREYERELMYRGKITKDKTSMGRYSFSWFHFHRIVYDEFHEINDRPKYIQKRIRFMSAEYIWGLTGTPRLSNLEDVLTCADFLNLDPHHNWRNLEIESARFIKNRVRRNEPNITFPAPIYETIFVSQTPAEFSFYRSHVLNSSEVNLLMLCNHYQITMSAEGDKVLTIEKVAERVQNSRATQINQMTRDIGDIVTSIARMQRELENGDEEAVAELNRHIARAQNRMNTIQNELRATQAQYNYFKNFVDSYADGTNDTNCAVCLEDRIIKQDAGVLPCGHAFCWECATNAVVVHRSCPSCRQPTTKDAIMQLSPPQKKKDVPVIEKYYEGVGRLDPNKFGSKIRELVDYIYATTKKSSDARFIVFIQFGNLADIVSNALHTYGINNVRLRQGWKTREAALRKFKESVAEVDDFDSDEDVDEEEISKKNKGKRKAKGVDDKENSSSKAIKTNSGKKRSKGAVKVMILSAKDSVSGLNLTEASHCIILHPFHSENEEYAIGAEDQGIARVLRNGQKKTVKIVRFVVRNTIEDEMHKRRQRIRQEHDDDDDGDDNDEDEDEGEEDDDDDDDSDDEDDDENYDDEKLCFEGDARFRTRKDSDERLEECWFYDMVLEARTSNPDLIVLSTFAWYDGGQYIAKEILDKRVPYVVVNPTPSAATAEFPPTGLQLLFKFPNLFAWKTLQPMLMKPYRKIVAKMHEEYNLPPLAQFKPHNELVVDKADVFTCIQSTSFQNRAIGMRTNTLWDIGLPNEANASESLPQNLLGFIERAKSENLKLLYVGFGSMFDIVCYSDEKATAFVDVILNGFITATNKISSPLRLIFRTYMRKDRAAVPSDPPIVHAFQSSIS